MMQLLIFAFLFITSAITFFTSDFILISDVYFYALIFLGVADYFNRGSISLFQTWQIAFVFIILSEALILQIHTPDMLQALKFLLLSNNVIILGYFSVVNAYRYRIKKILIPRSNESFPILFFVLVGLYFYFSLPSALDLFLLGRIGAADLDLSKGNVLVSSLIRSIGLILPSIIAFYYREIKPTKTILLPFLFSLPIFTLLLISGTRFPLLFSFGGFLIISFADRLKGRIRLNLRYVLFVSVLFVSAKLMASFRSYGFSDKTKYDIIQFSEERFTSKLAAQMSPEGVIDMTSLMMNHFDNHSHTLGASISFLTYFWIPRSVWPEKPTMLGNWLIREYRSGFSEGHSSSFGFTGELYADFGYFSMFFIFFLGVLLKRGDEYLTVHLSQSDGIQQVMAAMLFPYVFFFVRSPITSTITFLGTVVIYFFMKVLLMHKTSSRWILLLQSNNSSRILFLSPRKSISE